MPRHQVSRYVPCPEVFQESESQDMTATIEHVETARAHRLAMATLRLRLKPPHRSCGFVQGAWWPQSTRLADELPSLLTGLAPRFGIIDRVRYHESDWSPTPFSIEHQGDEVSLDATPELPNVITVFGEQVGKLVLLVVPPYADAADAYTAMTRAASVDDASTPAQLLGLRDRGTADSRHDLISLQRWEAEGGALQVGSHHDRIHGMPAGAQLVEST